MDKKEIALRGEEAAKLKQNPILKNFITDLRNQCFNDIEYAEDLNNLQDGQYMLKVLRRFERLLDHYIAQGELADKKLFMPRRLEAIE